MKRKRKVPETLWRLFSGRAKDLATAIVSLTHPNPPISCRHRTLSICLCCSQNPYSFLFRPGDPADYRSLLRRAYVVVPENAPPLNPSPEHRWPQREIVVKVIEMMNCYETAASNAILNRYDKVTRSSMIVEHLTLPAWSLLLERVGDDLMFYLLSYTSIFLPLTEGNHQQVAGFPIVSEMKKRKGDHTPFVLQKQLTNSYRPQKPILGKRSQPMNLCQKPRKKPRGVKLEEDNDVTSASVFLPADVGSMQRSHQSRSNKIPVQSPLFKVHRLVCNWDLINRQSMFYDSDRVSSVFPQKHALNGLKPSFENAKFLMKDMFGLSFTKESSGSMLCSKRRVCGAGSPCPYHSLAKLLKQLICRSRNCQHRKLLGKHCPVPCLDQETTPNRSCVFENLKCKQALGADDSASKLSMSYCQRTQVESFVWAVCRSIIPHELLGTTCNWRKLRQIISRFIQMQRFEKFSIRQCLHRLKVSEFPLILKLSSVIDHRVLGKAKRRKSNNSKGHDNLKDTGADAKQVLLANWVFWLFSFLVLPVLKANFYITETAFGRQELFYYRKSVWGKLKERALVQLSEDNIYNQLNKSAVREILGNRAFGFSKLRLLPKEKGMRIVANLQASSRMQSRFLKSVNSVLRETHAVLKGLQLKEPEKLGSSVFNYNDVYKKIFQFLGSLKKGSANLPTLFFVTCDVSRAFDSIDQNRLLSVMEEVLRKDKYHLQQSQHVCVKQFLKVDESLMLIDQDIKNPFPQSKSAILLGSSHAITSNQYCYNHVTKEALIDLLTEHVKGNLLKLNNNYYIQCKGIAQGSVLSSILCSLYYGHLERNVIVPFIKSTRRVQDFLLLRFIDDFMFVSTSKDQAYELLLKFYEGFSDYNCHMNVDKFSSSFDSENQLKMTSNKALISEDGTSFLRWAGLLVNSRTFEVQADYTRYHRNSMRSTLTVCWQRRLGFHSKRKLCDYMRPKCHPMFYDSNINSPAVVRLNIYQAFLVSAMKFHCYVFELSYMFKFWPAYHFRIINKSIRYMRTLIRNRVRSISWSCNIQPKLELERGEVEWLGLKAFADVLHKKQSRYRVLLGMLRRKLGAHELSGRESSDLAFAVGRSQNSIMWKIKY